MFLPGGVTLASDGNTKVNAVHRVSTDIQVGTNNLQLLAGDLLLSAKDNETLAGVVYGKEDVFVFRPDTFGDYTEGNFFRLIDGKNDTLWGDVAGFSLVEKTTDVGGVTLTAGEFLVAHNDASSDIQRFVPAPWVTPRRGRHRPWSRVSISTLTRKLPACTWYRPIPPSAGYP